MCVNMYVYLYIVHIKKTKLYDYKILYIRTYSTYSIIIRHSSIYLILYMQQRGEMDRANRGREEERERGYRWISYQSGTQDVNWHLKSKGIHSLCASLLWLPPVARGSLLHGSGNVWCQWWKVVT